jgi:hypothetical protein
MDNQSRDTSQGSPNDRRSQHDLLPQILAPSRMDNNQQGIHHSASDTTEFVETPHERVDGSFNTVDGNNVWQHRSHWDAITIDNNSLPQTPYRRSPSAPLDIRNQNTAGRNAGNNQEIYHFGDIVTLRREYYRFQLQLRLVEVPEEEIEVWMETYGLYINPNQTTPILPTYEQSESPLLGYEEIGNIRSKDYIGNTPHPEVSNP